MINYKNKYIKYKMKYNNIKNIIKIRGGANHVGCSTVAKPIYITTDEEKSKIPDIIKDSIPVPRLNLAKFIADNNIQLTTNKQGFLTYPNYYIRGTNCNNTQVIIDNINKDIRTNMEKARDAKLAKASKMDIKHPEVQEEIQLINTKFNTDSKNPIISVLSELTPNKIAYIKDLEEGKGIQILFTGE
jgi:hypothetical protein